MGRSLEDEKANHPEGPLELPPFAALALSTQTITSFFLHLFFKCDSAIKILLSALCVTEQSMPQLYGPVFAFWPLSVPYSHMPFNGLCVRSQELSAQK